MMKLHILFGHRHELYVGEHAPEPLLCWSEFEVEENPDGFEAAVKETLTARSKDFAATRLFAVHVDDDLVVRALHETPVLRSKVEPAGRLVPEPAAPDPTEDRVFRTFLDLLVSELRKDFGAEHTTISAGTVEYEGWTALDVVFMFVRELSVADGLHMDRREVHVRAYLRVAERYHVWLQVMGTPNPVKVTAIPDAAAKLIFARAWFDDARS